MDRFRILDHTVTALMTVCTLMNFYVFQQTVVLLHETQKEINVMNLHRASPYDYATKFTTLDTIEPLPRSFWMTFFLVSPTLALVWYGLIDLTISNVIKCAAWPQLRVLEVAKEKGYHLSPRYQVALSPFVISVAFDNFVFWWNVVQMLRTCRALIRREERRARHPHEFSQAVDPLLADLNNFNLYQLQSLENELRDALEVEANPTQMYILRKRRCELEKTLASRKRTNRYERQSVRAPSPSEECVICWNYKPMVTFSPCGHTVICDHCIDQWKKMAETNRGRDTCPQCRMCVMNMNFLPTYPHTYISRKEYSRQRDEATNRELKRLYMYTREKRASVRVLKHCPTEAFQSQEGFAMVSGRSGILGNR
eukprot:CFRG5818T1